MIADKTVVVDLTKCKHVGMLQPIIKEAFDFPDMKMMDCVEVIVEKEKYAKNGVHKGMQGRICCSTTR